MLELREALTYDDVLVQPQYSDIDSRSKVDLSIKISKLETTYKHPIIPSNMKTIFGIEMARSVYNSGGMGFLHRFDSVENQIKIFKQLEIGFGLNIKNHIGFSVGVKKDDYDNVKTFVELGAKILCVDIAHGHSKTCIDMCKFISTTYPEIFLVAGNTASYEGSYDLWMAGADMVKNGVGGGSICLTRVNTGSGVPMITSLSDAFEAKKRAYFDLEGSRELFLISDGGVKAPGDVVKSSVFADFSMIGNMFAGCDETPSDFVTIDGKLYKEYVGSSTHRNNNIEGVKAIVPAKGSFQDILTRILEGLASGCSYSGAHNLKELRRKAKLIRTTNAGLIESKAHDVIVR